MPAKLELTHACYLEAWHYDNLPSDIYLNYIEFSPDPWYSNTETSITLTKELAQEIVAFLTEHFQLKPRA